VCEVLAVSDWRVSSATEGSHRRRAPRAPAPRHAVVNTYLLRSSKIINYTVVQKSLLLGLYDGGHASWAGRASEMFHVKYSLLLGLYYGRRAPAPRDAVVNQTR
jgi:hypothetical protein